MFAVTVRFVVKEANVDDFEKAIKSQSINSLSRESGCHQFDVCFDHSDKKKVFLYELYTNKAEFEKHLETKHFLEFDSKVKGWLASKVVENWEQWSEEKTAYS